MRTPKYFNKWYEGWPQLVCFDLDGTLVDSVPDLAAAVDSFLIAHDQSPAGEERVRQWVGFGAAKLVEQAMEWAAMDLNQHEECYRKFLITYQENLTQKTQLYPHVLDLLKAFKTNKVPMAIVTNKPSVFVKPILDHFQLTDYFAWILGADTLPEKKPSPMPLLHCAEAIEAEPEQCLMIGDSLTDYRAANDAGFRSAIVTYGYHQGVDIRSLGADVMLDDLVELLL